MPSLKPSIRFCAAPDGTRIAAATLGAGPPLVRVAHWLSHIEYDPQSPVWRPWLRELSRSNAYISYDQRGCGLSDRDVTEFNLERLVDDLEAVVDDLGLETFSLLGMSQGGAIATAFAARRPERVNRLVLLGAYARGLRTRDDSAETRMEAETLANLIRLGWGKDNAAFRQVFTSQYIPGGSIEQHRWWNDLQRQAATPETAARILETLHWLDVTETASRVRAPTLAMHARGDARVPFEEGRLLASLIPGARFVTLESDNHVLLETEPAWGRFLTELRSFLAVAPAPHAFPSLTSSEREVLTQMARGLANGAIAERLGKSEKTVRNQASSIFAKLGASTRAEAIVLARDGRLDSE